MIGSNLQEQLHMISSLAWCEEFIRAMRNKKGIPEDVQNWIFNGFDLHSSTENINRDTGAIAHRVYLNHGEMFNDLNNLSARIYANPKQLNNTDWDLILCGVELYRKHLLNQAFIRQICGSIY